VQRPSPSAEVVASLVFAPRPVPFFVAAGMAGDVIAAAQRQIGWPYVWGGESRTEGGFDCSGLVAHAFWAAGLPLPGRPTAAVLWQMSKPISRGQLRPGDLVFLGAASGAPHHVALYVGVGMVVVARHTGTLITLQRLDAVAWDGFGRLIAAEPGPGRVKANERSGPPARGPKGAALRAPTAGEIRAWLRMLGAPCPVTSAAAAGSVVVTAREWARTEEHAWL
jgi:hypothetical protein